MTNLSCVDTVCQESQAKQKKKAFKVGFFPTFVLCLINLQRLITKKNREYNMTCRFLPLFLSPPCDHVHGHKHGISWCI